MLLIFSIVIILYTTVIIYISYGFSKFVYFDSYQIQPIKKFSILIPFRNESTNLPKLLESISKIDYPISFYEVLLIDDASDDTSVAIIKSFMDKHSQLPLNLLKSKGGKKKAIAVGIQKASFEWILTTDADCDLPKKWILTYDSFLQKNDAKLIAGPVIYESKHSFFEQFQQLDLLSLMGSTMGGFGIKKPFLCNGANLCYQRSTFLELRGFEGNESIASGDDIFLLEKVINVYPKQAYFIKSRDAIVSTKPQQTWKGLISQRIRWAAKTRFYKNKTGKLVGLSVFSMNFLILFLVIKYPFLCLFVFFGKICLDFFLIWKTAIFLNKTNSLNYYFFGSLFYPFFCVFIVLLLFMKGYKWKGRYLKK